MILRIDKNKVLHIISANDLFAGENTQEIIQVLIHPTLINVEPSECEFILHFKNTVIQNEILPLFLSNEKQDSFYIAESILDSKITSISGFSEVWLEIQTPSSKINTTLARFSVKPAREQNTYKYTSIEASDLENKLLTIRNECKIYYDMAKKEADKAKKCVEIMIKILKEKEGGI